MNKPDCISKAQTPFRLGCTSYVIPDAILPNVRKMAPLVDDIELVIFETPEFGNMPDNQAVRELCDIAINNNITYSVHLPVNFKAGSPDKTDRERFVKQASEVIELFCDVPVSGFIMHLEGLELHSRSGSHEAFNNAVHESCAGVSEKAGEKRHLVKIENLALEVEENLVISSAYGFGICLDVGHLFLSDPNWKETFQKYALCPGVIHFHGIENGKDHKSLACGPESYVSEVVKIIRETGYDRVVTLEVFGENDTFESIEVIKKICRQ